MTLKKLTFLAAIWLLIPGGTLVIAYYGIQKFRNRGVKHV